MPQPRRASNSSDTGSRRYSLPYTFESSTHVTKEKAEKVMMNRRQTRRQSLRESPSNDVLQSPTPYWKVAKERGVSPPETRSTKKNKNVGGKKLNFSPPDKENVGSNMKAPPREDFLVFSPPDQVANAQREKEELERKEKARAKRVRKARDSGQLLIFSPTLRNPAYLPVELENPNPVEEKEPNDVPPAKGNESSETRKIETNGEDNQSTVEDLSTPRNMEVDLTDGSEASQVSCVTTQSNDPGSNRFANELKSLRQNVARLVDSKVSSENNRRQQEAEKLNLETQMMRIETLTTASSKLEKTNGCLELAMKDMESKNSAEREHFLVETARLETERATANRRSDSRIQGLEETKDKLETKVSSLQEERISLSTQVAKLETEVVDARGRLCDSKLMLQALKEELGQEKSTIAEDGEELARGNADLSSELQQMKSRNDALEQTIKEYEETIDTFENILLPESEDQLQKALEELKYHEEAENEARAKISEYEQATQGLKKELEALRQEKEEERANFQTLNEDSSQAYEQMTKEIADKNKCIEALEQRIRSTEEDLALESIKVDQAVEEMRNLKARMDQRVRELEKSLDDLSRQLKESTSEKQELEQKLADALDQIHKDSEFKEEALSESNEKSATLKAMDEEKRLMHQRINELEQQQKATRKERDDARSRMETFNDREEELFNRLRESDRVRRGLHNRVMQLSGNIRVYVRVRPALPGEEELSMEASRPPSGARGQKRKLGEIEKESLFRYPGMGGSSSKKSSVGADDPTKNLLEVTEPKKDRGGLSERRKKWTYGFDHVFNPSHGQEDIWEATDPLVQSAIDGFDVTLFAYGQTGSGKTFTMLGESGNEGIITRAVQKLFDAKREIEELSRGESKVELSVELLEIYNENVRDLLAPNSGPEGQEISLKVTGNEAIGNIILPASNEGEVKEIMHMAQKRRCVKATASNAVSSRGHMLFTIHFQLSSSNGISRAGKLHVCDLAGSERLGKSNANAHVGGALLRETKHINTSLSVLSNVIEKLQAGDPNVPFRESKLTYLLQNSLGGNSKTLAIVCCNPLQSHFHESLCSLRFAAKVNQVDLKAVANFSC